MKGFTQTLKSMKDSHRYLKENDVQTKDLIHQVVDYFSFLNGLLNYRNEDLAMESADGASLKGKTTKGASTANAFNQISSNDKEKSLLLNKANDALKRLQISFFRNQVSNKKLKASKLSQFDDTVSKNIFKTTKNALKTANNSVMDSRLGHHSNYRLNSPSMVSITHLNNHQASGTNLTNFVVSG